MSLRTAAITGEDADAVVEIGPHPVALIPLTKSYGPLLSGLASVLKNHALSWNGVALGTFGGRLLPPKQRYGTLRWTRLFGQLVK